VLCCHIDEINTRDDRAPYVLRYSHFLLFDFSIDIIIINVKKKDTMV
jgi:hypothetical protein